MERVFNFSAGPAILPMEVLEEASKGILDFENKGMSVIEMSHRSKPIDNLNNETQSLVKEILGLSDKYHVLFLGGGASLQFSMIPMNLLQEGKGADYIITGSWSKKALDEAKKISDNINVIFTSKETNFNRVPKESELKINPDASYVHLTSNNTIFGTQMRVFPKSPVPIVADMSSDMLSYPFDPTNFGLIYAGAQKNLGPAGITLVIIRDDMIKNEKEKTPTMLKYSTHIENQSMYNTPPVFGIFIMNLVLKWIKKNGGLATMNQKNLEKAKLIYDAIDNTDFYIGHAEKDSRSLMNITWNLADKNLEEKFLAESKALKLDGLKGHRSVGGFRASVYNAMPLEGCRVLAKFMTEFARLNG